MDSQADQGHHASDDRVPVENPGIRTGSPVGPEGQEEVTVGPQRHSANHVGQGRAEKHCQERAGQKEKPIEE